MNLSDSHHLEGLGKEEEEKITEQGDNLEGDHIILKDNSRNQVIDHGAGVAKQHLNWQLDDTRKMVQANTSFISVDDMDQGTQPVQFQHYQTQMRVTPSPSDFIKTKRLKGQSIELVGQIVEEEKQFEIHEQTPQMAKHSTALKNSNSDNDSSEIKKDSGRRMYTIKRKSKINECRGDYHHSTYSNHNDPSC